VNRRLRSVTARFACGRECEERVEPGRYAARSARRVALGLDPLSILEPPATHFEVRGYGRTSKRAPVAGRVWDLGRRLVGPIVPEGSLCITGVVAEVEPHGYRLGSPAASIVGMTQQLLDRGGFDEEVATHLRAIRDLALELVREAELNNRGTQE
jgi:hypothetical protein